jgi:hypothetical protein
MKLEMHRDSALQPKASAVGYDGGVGTAVDTGENLGLLLEAQK